MNMKPKPSSKTKHKCSLVFAAPKPPNTNPEYVFSDSCKIEIPKEERLLQVNNPRSKIIHFPITSDMILCPIIITIGDLE